VLVDPCGDAANPAIQGRKRFPLGAEKPNNRYDISAFRVSLVNVIPLSVPGVEGGRPGSACITSWDCFRGKNGACLGC
jgi:hypothetical protein